ncbi:MAG: L-histidine N(alpha)-methyltransferase [Acidobacteriota bacterium]
MSEPEIPDRTEQFARDVRRGLRSEPKFLLAKYFYDERGSELFEEITRQPEYYPTPTEAEILRRHASDIRAAMGGNINLVELGSGSSLKTRILLKTILEDQNQLVYLPIDISPTILEQTVRVLDLQFPALEVTAIASEYEAGLRRASVLLAEGDELPSRKLVLFLGSSIGNLEPPQAQAFLRRIRQRLEARDGLLVGFDLQKDEKVLNAAYNDRAGVTARFNLNLLARINRELGGEFDLNRFCHRAFYRQDEGRVEMHLVSRSEQRVSLRQLKETFSFDRGETIHTESSYKYTPETIQSHARAGGFRLKEVFTDDNQWFSLALFVPA